MKPIATISAVFMRTVTILTIVSVSIGTAFAGTDYKCMNDCQGRGYLYQYCSERCSYNDGGDSPGFMESVAAGAKAAADIEKNQMQSKMLRNADVACKQGDQQACSDLRQMLFNK
jgi:hypothetical protein